MSDAASLAGCSVENLLHSISFVAGVWLCLCPHCLTFSWEQVRFLGPFYFMWTKHLLRVVWLGDQTWQSPCSEHETIMWGFGLAFPHSLSWIAPLLQQRQLLFFSSIRGQGRYLGQHEPWFLNQPRLSCGMGSKKEVAPIKPDLCQLVMPATDRRPFNKVAPTIAEHCLSQSPPTTGTTLWSSMTGVHDPTHAFLPRTWDVHWQGC